MKNTAAKKYIRQVKRLYRGKRRFKRQFIQELKDKRQTVVKALCLHIAHDCNLACKYCFAEEGEYHGRRAMMSFEVGKKALDFLVANSGSRVNLEVDFFGGEPLMNWDVVKQLVEYGRSLEESNHKKFRFTLTTNGVLLNDEIMEYLNKEMSNVVLSLDGRKEVNDRMRPFRTGKGSYDLIVTKSRSVMYSLRWILILASYTSFDNCLGSQYSSSAVVPSNNAGFIHFSRTSQFPKLTPFTFINVHPTFLSF